VKVENLTEAARQNIHHCFYGRITQYTLLTPVTSETDIKGGKRVTKVYRDRRGAIAAAAIVPGQQQ
jgi:hypothetical protein